MYDTAARAAALALIAEGLSLNAVSLRTGIARSTLRAWRERPEPARRVTDCPRCACPPRPPAPPDTYAYLLGLYLGDGCLGKGRRDVYALRIACADAWPGLMDECASAIVTVRPGHAVGRVPKQGCHMVTATWKHWPCLFPQHGPGRKHERRIALEPWQDEVVAAHPGPFVRGLFHSDGCRVVNEVRREVAGGVRVYAYPRYMFSNRSADILGLCGQALDRLGIAWRLNNTYSLSVARSAAVARLDEHVGPKY